MLEYIDSEDEQICNAIHHAFNCDVYELSEPTDFESEVEQISDNEFIETMWTNSDKHLPNMYIDVSQQGSGKTEEIINDAKAIIGSDKKYLIFSNQHSNLNLNFGIISNYV